MAVEALLLPGAGYIAVENEHTRRLQEGDPVVGWEGDPNIRVRYDSDTGLYDAWTLLDSRGNALPAGEDPCGPGVKTVLLVALRPYCDHRMILDVIAADNRRSNVIAKTMRTQQQAKKAQKRTFADRMAEAADKLHFAVLKDLGHRRQF